MLQLILPRITDRNLRVLCLGAHSDDIEVGCGGSVLRLLSERDDVEVHWVVFSGTGRRKSEALKSAEKFLRGSREKDIRIQRFEDGHFPYIGSKIKNYFEKLKLAIQPDIIFSHCRHDLHQDHREISNLTWNTFRDHLILEYEVIKYDGDLGVPNIFVHLDEDICREKVKYILESFVTQRSKDWFAEDAFFSILRIRGMESRARSNYAEAFYCRKLVL